MTNAEKYLKDGVIDDFVCAFDDFCAIQTSNQASGVRLAQFLSRTIKPILTEDERVILRNINKIFNRIERNKFGFLILTEDGCENVGEAMHTLYAFNHLFQFIKERRRI